MRVRLKDSATHPDGWEGWDEFEIYASLTAMKSVLIFRELPTKDDEFSDARVVSLKYQRRVLAKHYETIPTKDKPNARPQKTASGNPKS